VARVKKDASSIRVDTQNRRRSSRQPAGLLRVGLCRADGRNKSVFGLDISNNPSAANPRSIADALASARDSGNLTSSASCFAALTT